MDPWATLIEKVACYCIGGLTAVVTIMFILSIVGNVGSRIYNALNAAFGKNTKWVLLVGIAMFLCFCIISGLVARYSHKSEVNRVYEDAPRVPVEKETIADRNTKLIVPIPDNKDSAFGKPETIENKETQPDANNSPRTVPGW